MNRLLGKGAAAPLRLASAVLRAVTATLLVSTFLVASMPGGALWVSAVWLLSLVGINFGRFYAATQRLIAHAYFAIISFFVIGILLQSRDLPLMIMLASLSNMAAWTLFSQYWRLREFERNEGTNRLILRHLVALALLTAISLIAYFVSQSASLTLTTWQNIGLGALTVGGLLAILGTLRRRYQSFDS